VECIHSHKTTKYMIMEFLGERSQEDAREASRPSRATTVSTTKARKN